MSALKLSTSLQRRSTRCGWVNLQTLAWCPVLTVIIAQEYGAKAATTFIAFHQKSNKCLKARPFRRRFQKLKAHSIWIHERCGTVKAWANANMMDYALTKNAT